MDGRNEQRFAIKFCFKAGLVAGKCARPQSWKFWPNFDPPKMLQPFIAHSAGSSSSVLLLRFFSVLWLTRLFIRQGHAREKCTAQPVRAAWRSIEGNGRGEAVTSRRYGNCLTASKQGACTAQPVRAATRLQAQYAFFALCNMLKAASFFYIYTNPKKITHCSQVCSH